MGGDGKVTAVIPAHNEAVGIATAIAAVAPQVDYVLVVSDNSTDDTEAVARAAIDATGTPGHVMRTVANTARKAGALNQALAMLDPRSGEYVLAMDADTVLSPGWVDKAFAALDNAGADAAGAVFRADRSDTWLTMMEAMEYCRYEEQLDRTGRTHVLSGTAALIKADALRAIQDRFGRIYDEGSICEDFKLTVDLKRTGAVLTSPRSLLVTTETMPTLRDLFLQRRRWSLGALQVCTRSGTSRVLWTYWRQQALLLVGIIALWAYLAVTAYGVATSGFHVSGFWLIVGLAFAFERVATVWDAGPRARVVAALIVPEIVYATVLQVAHLAAIVQFITGSSGTWHHVPTPAASLAATAAH